MDGLGPYPTYPTSEVLRDNCRQLSTLLRQRHPRRNGCQGPRDAADAGLHCYRQGSDKWPLQVVWNEVAIKGSRDYRGAARSK